MDQRRHRNGVRLPSFRVQNWVRSAQQHKTGYARGLRLRGARRTTHLEPAKPVPATKVRMSSRATSACELFLHMKIRYKDKVLATKKDSRRVSCVPSTVCSAVPLTRNCTNVPYQTGKVRRKTLNSATRTLPSNREKRCAHLCLKWKIILLLQLSVEQSFLI